MLSLFLFLHFCPFVSEVGKLFTVGAFVGSGCLTELVITRGSASNFVYVSVRAFRHGRPTIPLVRRMLSGVYWVAPNVGGTDSARAGKNITGVSTMPIGRVTLVKKDITRVSYGRFFSWMGLVLRWGQSPLSNNSDSAD